MTCVDARHYLWLGRCMLPLVRGVFPGGRGRRKGNCSKGVWGVRGTVVGRSACRAVAAVVVVAVVVVAVVVVAVDVQAVVVQAVVVVAVDVQR